jgi:hypothetical protein
VSARPKAITVLALLMIAIGLIGIVANGYGFLVSDPAYSRRLWLTFVGLKAAGLIAGLLLLQMRRAGVWLFTAAFIGSLAIAISSTGSHSLTQWLGAGLVAAIVAGGGWLAIRHHWGELRGMGGLGRA